MRCLEYTLILDLIVAKKMPAFCLGCLGCLKCLVPSFVPVLGSLAVTFFMVSWFDYKVLPTSPTLPSKLMLLFPHQDLPTPVIAILLAFLFSLPFLPRLFNSSSPSKAAQVSETSGAPQGISETKSEATE